MKKKVLLLVFALLLVVLTVSLFTACKDEDLDNAGGQQQQDGGGGSGDGNGGESNSSADEVSTPTEELKYELNEDGNSYKVVGIDTETNVTHLVIPDTYNGKPVTSIDYPSSSGFVYVPNFIFYNLKITSVKIPASVTHIETGSFGHNELVSIEVSPENPVYHSNGNCLIETASKKIILGCKTSIIPNDGTVTTIGDGAFFECIGLTAINIPANIVYIEDGAFSTCVNVETITAAPENTVYETKGNCLIEKVSKTMVLGCKNSILPNDGSLTTIGEEAFAGCAFPRDLAIPESVTLINHFGLLFNEIASIVVDTENTVYYSQNNCLIRRADKTLILGCKNSIIPDDGSVTVIGSDAFSLCYNLTSITIPNDITTIGSSAFANCKELKTIVLSDNLINIGDGAFQQCEKLESIVFPESLETIESLAFMNCISIKNIHIPKNVQSLAYDAFGGCNEIESFTVDTQNPTYTAIGNCLINRTNQTLLYAFKNFVIPNDGSVKTIGFQAFNSGIKTLTIPSNVTKIAAQAFSHLPELTTVTISNDMESIGGMAFAYCEKLTDIYYQGTKAEWDEIIANGQQGNGFIIIDGSIFGDSQKVTVHCTDGDIINE